MVNRNVGTVFKSCCWDNQDVPVIPADWHRLSSVNSTEAVCVWHSQRVSWGVFFTLETPGGVSIWKFRRSVIACSHTVMLTSLCSGPLQVKLDVYLAELTKIGKSQKYTLSVDVEGGRLVVMKKVKDSQEDWTTFTHEKSENPTHAVHRR